MRSPGCWPAPLPGLIIRVVVIIVVVVSAPWVQPVQGDAEHVGARLLQLPCGVCQRAFLRAARIRDDEHAIHLARHHGCVRDRKHGRAVEDDDVGFVGQRLNQVAHAL